MLMYVSHGYLAIFDGMCMLMLMYVAYLTGLSLQKQQEGWTPKDFAMAGMVDVLARFGNARLDKGLYGAALLMPQLARGEIPAAGRLNLRDENGRGTAHEDVVCRIWVNGIFMDIYIYTYLFIRFMSLSWDIYGIWYWSWNMAGRQIPEPNSYFNGHHRNTTMFD